MVRICYAEARRAKRTLQQLFSGHQAVAVDPTGHIDDRDQRERAFRRLSVQQRAVVVLHHYVGMSLPEVADTLGIAEGTASSRLSRAMDKLRLALAVDAPARDPIVSEVP